MNDLHDFKGLLIAFYRMDVVFETLEQDAGVIQMPGVAVDHENKSFFPVSARRGRILEHWSCHSSSPAHLNGQLDFIHYREHTQDKSHGDAGSDGGNFASRAMDDRKIT